SEASGKPLWTYAFYVSYPDWAFRPGEEAGPSATPIVEAGRIFALGANGDVHCLNAVNGGLLWRKSLQREYEIPQLICRASPLIDGDLLIVCVGGKPGACVIALDKKSGKEVWRALDESVTNSSPIIIAAGGKRQLIVWTQESVTSLDSTTGKTFWLERFISNNNDAVSSPAFHQNFLLIAGLMFKFDAPNPASPAPLPASKAAF